jgi:hypothetical protein
VIEKNGEEPKAVEPHAIWCRRISEASSACSCYPIPALRCDSCRMVFEATATETAIEFHRRVLAHAMVHPDTNPSFTQGRVERTPRQT